MKTCLLFMIIFLSVMLKTSAQNVGIGTVSPAGSAALEIKSASKGLLIPRTSSASRIAIVNPAKGLLVYDTTTSSFWFHNGTLWSNLSAGGSVGWLLTGNSGSDPSTDFIGTADNSNLRFKINDTNAGLLTNKGNVFWGLRSGNSITNGYSNIAVGTDALKANTLNSNIVAIGDSALFNNGTGANAAFFEGGGNTAIGSKTLYSNTKGYSNTASGYVALYSNTTGNRNTANGYYGLNANTTGNDNIAVGYAALLHNTTANENTAVGNYALSKQIFNNGGIAWTSGNTAIGYNALQNNYPTAIDNGVFNTAIGHSALLNNSTGSYNTATGYGTLYNNTSGYYNTAGGYAALFINTTGYRNTAIGQGALYSNDVGYANTANGYGALAFNTNGYHNTAVGNEALTAGGSNCTATGSRALYSNTTVNNTADGFEALFKTTSGFNNAAVGFQALYHNIDGVFNTAIGYAADVALPGLSNTTAIGFAAVVNSSNKMQLGNTITATISTSGGYTIASDGRFKDNLREDVKGLDFIMKLHPVTYNFNYNRYDQFLRNDESENTAVATGARETSNKRMNNEKLEYKRQLTVRSDKRETGFVAQDVEKAVKESGYTGFNGVYVPTNDKDNYSLDYSKLVVPLVKGMQEQQAIIDEQNKKIELLEKRLAAIEKNQAGLK
jgi:hypothetical protein